MAADNSIAAQIRARFAALGSSKGGTADLESADAGSNPAPRIPETPTPPASDTGGAGQQGSERENESIPNIADSAAKSTASSKLRYALAYARRGFRVFQCHHIEADRECSCGKLECASAGKHPRNKGWQAEATTDEATIRQWWTQEPEANIGVACGQQSGLTVLDVDGDLGRNTLRELELEHGELPEAPIVLTGSGGCHYYFAYQPEIGNAVRFAQGLDVRTEGGLVVGAGSRNGKGEYRWETMFQLGDSLLPPAMPKWLITAIKQAGAAPNGKPVLDTAAVLNGPPDGQRDDKLFRLACKLRHADVPKDMALKLVAEAAAKATPPFDEATALSKVHRAYEKYLPSQTTEPESEASTLPAVFIRNTIEILTWESLRERRRAHVLNWAVEGWLAKGEMSLWSGKVEHGKTTLMRELTLCKVRGEPFLGHDCPPGRVFYAMLDADGENLTFDEFEKMGMTDADTANIRFLFEPMLARMERGPEQFFRAIWDWQPDIVIIDPFARLKEIGDFNDYNNTYLMGMLSHYCKISNAHFALPGHIPRGRPPGSAAATAAQGSIAFGGGVNARFVVERKEGTDIHTLRSSKGKSAGFKAMEGEHVLERDEYTGRINLGKAFSFGHQAAALKDKVLELLNEAPLQDWTPHAIAKELGAPSGLVRAAAGMLYDDKKIERTGTGKKGNAYQYQKVLGVPGKVPLELVQRRFPD